MAHGLNSRVSGHRSDCWIFDLRVFGVHWLILHTSPLLLLHCGLHSGTGMLASVHVWSNHSGSPLRRPSIDDIWSKFGFDITPDFWCFDKSLSATNAALFS